MVDKSIEAGYATGDLGEFSYDHFGGRFNIQVSPAAMLYFYAGKTDVEETDGTSFCAGLFYQLDDVVEAADFAIKGSYHTVDLERSGYTG